MTRAWMAIAMLSACGGGNSSTPVDAPSASADAPAVPPGTHTLYLATEGLQVVQYTDDNPVLNHATFIPTTTNAIAFAHGATDRAATIADLVAEVKSIVAPYDIQVVTERPSRAPYIMVVITDSPATDFGFPASTAGAQTSTCAAVASATMLVFGASYPSNHARAAVIVGDMGLEQVIPQTTKAGDCMCYASASCTAPTAACTIGGAGTPVDQVDDPCGPPATIDEGARWLAAFGAHP